jgi:hypothetical protein
MTATMTLLLLAAAGVVNGLSSGTSRPGAACSELDTICPRTTGGAAGGAAGVVLRCDACVGKHQAALQQAGCTAADIQAWCAAAGAAQRCGCYANFSHPLNLDTLPTGNACPGACITSTAFSVQGSTSHDDKREFLVSLGLTSNRGAKSRPTPYHDKVTLYSGIVGEAGTGDIWAFNPLVTQLPGSGDYNAQGIELDYNNLNAHRGDADGGFGLAAPVSYGLSVTGAGNYRSSAAIGVMGEVGMWNRGIVFANNCVNQSTFQDLGSAQHKSIDIRGSPVYGIYQSSLKTKNLFAGNTSVAGELRLSGAVVHVSKDGKQQRGPVLSNSGSEELTSSGVAPLRPDGTATITLVGEGVFDGLCGAESVYEHSYQLTAHGRPMPDLFVKAELGSSDGEGGGCTFSVGGGGESGGKVSWRVHSTLGRR